MAFITADHRHADHQSFGQRLAAAFTRFMERQSRQEEIARLEAKTDAQLAAMGLTRDGIVRHVFRDRFYL
ncbi:hypothetical protein [Thioclava atlantica]|uniref:DUF1127 domain-containing protein n=1 Tax=Thioclava atlantica TaxID=1317124 RepID=A0A085U098_9RHOB|nr:hypothetical protein [Thioclava atlantica]KFE36395.1 hypothetical protein DW2_03764 [Thioclava atlantica]